MAVSNDEHTRQSRLWTQRACNDYAHKVLDLVVDEHELAKAIHDCERIYDDCARLAPTVRQQLYECRRNEVRQFFQERVYDFQDLFNPDAGEWRLFGADMIFTHNTTDMAVVGRTVLVATPTISLNHLIEELNECFQQEINVSHIRQTNELVVTVPYLSRCIQRVIAFAVYKLMNTNNNDDECGADGDYHQHICLHAIACPLRTINDVRSPAFSDLTHNHRGQLLYSNERDAYICVSSGVSHLCGEMCNLLETSREGHWCRRTGMTVALRTHTTDGMASTSATTSRFMRAEEVHWTQWSAARRRAKNTNAITNISIDDYLYRNVANNTPMAYLLATGASETYSLKHHTASMNPTMMYVVMAQMKLAALLSDERMHVETQQHCDASRAKIETELDRFESKLAQNQKPLDLIGAATVTANVRNKRERVSMLAPGTLDHQARHELTMRHANNCVLLWWIVLTQTRYGREHPTEFRFHTFVLAAVSLFEGGFVVYDERIGSTIKLIAPDPTLQIFNLERAIEAFHYRYHNNNATNANNNNIKTPQAVSRARIQRNAIAAMRESIQTALRNAIMHDDVTPQSLQVNNAAMNDLDLTQFQQLVMLTSNARPPTPKTTRI